MYGLSAGTQKAAVVERWLLLVERRQLVKVRLYPYASCKMDMRSIRKKRSRLSLTNNVLFTITSVVCAMQTMSGIRADTSISALRNTKDCLQSGITLKNNMEQSQVTYIAMRF